MPTGYTAPVQEGDITELKDYAAMCARAFGVFMHQRDDDPDAPLRYPEPTFSDFYARELPKAQAALEQWKNMTEEQKYDEWSLWFREETKRRHERLAKSHLENSRYQAMLAQVISVDVPSELVNFKEFLVSQLTDSIKHDCLTEEDVDRFYGPTDYVDWCESRTRRVLRDVVRYTEEARKEEERRVSQLAYIDSLITTFGIEVQK